MKNTITILLLIIGFSLHSQSDIETLDYSIEKKLAVYASENKNISLFFPKPIRQAMVGADNYLFSYNTETPQYLGVLKASQGKESNLLVITTDGMIYSFIIRYSKVIDKLTYFVKNDNSIGHETGNKPIVIEKDDTFNFADSQQPDLGSSIAVATSPNQLNGNDITVTQNYVTTHFKRKARDTSYFRYNKDRKEYIRRFCSNLVTVNNKTKAKSTLTQENEGIKVSLIDLVFNYNEMYMVIEVDNGNAIDYDVNFLNVSLANNKKKKRKSAQTIYKKPIATYQLAPRIKGNTATRVVYVFPKFSINKEKKVIIELNEWGGERNVTLNVAKNYINNPKSI